MTSNGTVISDPLTGGCQCGRIRYAVRVGNLDAYLCHCRMCQRATGGFAAALKQVRRADVTWATEPDRYRSSAIAQRGFCSSCGTPLTYEGDSSDGMDLTFGSFDRPERLVPVEHSGGESMHPAWLDTSALPRQRTEDNETIVRKWTEACGKLPD